MPSHYVSIPSLLAVAGCAGAGAHSHDTMIAELRSIERDRASAIGEELALGTPALDRAALVAAVLARNPELEAARETWRAQAAAYPSAVAIADPMLTYEIAPLSIAGDVPFGQRVQVTQKLPYPGKRSLAGEAALGEAAAAQADYATLRLELAEAAVDAFDDDYVAARALEVNAHHRELLERIEHSATAQYSVSHASQQDPLEARAEIIALDRERLMIEAQRRAAVARINRLLRRPAAAELPPPPARLDVTVRAAKASTSHPKLAAAQARLRARGADLERARRDFYPDFELMGSYDSTWDTWQHRWMIGVGIEIPLQRDRRRADVERARAEQAKATAELAKASDMLDEDRERARREVDEMLKAIELYDRQLLPTARARVDAALAGFSSNQNPFSTVVMAEHALRGIELQIEQARADLDRRLAALDRAEGRIPGGGR